jgi:hypothetical protein
MRFAASRRFGQLGTVVALAKAGNISRSKLLEELHYNDNTHSAGMTGDLG